MEFINRYRHRLEYVPYNYRGLVSGSSTEIPAIYFFTDPTDIDFMLYSANVCAIPRNFLPPKDFLGEVLTIDPQQLPPGYVTLKDSKFENYNRLTTYEYDDPNGPALRTPVGWSNFTMDGVYSVQCPYWPPEAHEWKTRYRPRGWPSKDLIDQIVSEGSFLVGKSHPSCLADKTQWRYSFSKAEIRLLSSWTDSQMYVYHVLRLIKSKIVKKSDDKKQNGLCTYHLKTQMFWACEEYPADFWEESNLMTCICELLATMEERFATRKFSNYFLPDCNIVDGNSGGSDLRTLLTLLNTAFDTSILLSILPPRVCHECRISSKVPAKLAPFAHLYANRFGKPFQALSPKLDKVQELIDDEFTDLLKGIYNTQLANIQNESYYEAAEYHFYQGTVFPETVQSMTLENRASLSSVRCLYESFENVELSTLKEDYKQWEISVVTSCTKDQCPYAGKSGNVPWNDKGRDVFEKWMNPTHLLSAAFLSCLHFKTERYQLCIETVLWNHSLATNAFYSEHFPMIFCPELASLFDEDIQEVLGFIWLCKHLRDGEQVFEFFTCPQLVMLYFAIQSSIKLNNEEEFNFYENYFNKHRSRCNYRFHLFSAHYLPVEIAWRNGKRRWAHRLKSRVAKILVLLSLHIGLDSHLDSTYRHKTPI